MEYIPDEACVKSSCVILCCQCGIQIQPNPANMCVPCIRTRVDITASIPKQMVIYYCKNCNRYLSPPANWIQCDLESRDLLAYCLKRLRGLSEVTLIDATFVWTEPHSKRIKVKLTVQKEVLGGAILQQVFIVEYVVNYNMCDDCHKGETPHFWRAVVQTRQKVQHKKTFFYLEQLILKHQMHANCVKISSSHVGMDFFFAKKDDARKLVDFFTSVVPCKYITAQQLISHDIRCNTYNYKFTFSVEIVPVCKHDIVCLPRAVAHNLGSIGQICIVSRVTAGISLIDPNSLQMATISCQQYWKTPFHAIASLKNLTEYTVMNTELIRDSDKRTFSGQGPVSFKHVLADAWVVKSSQLGMTDTLIHTRTHLGHLLKPGDLVLGMDITCSNVNNKEFDKLDKENLPDVILVKKIYENKSVRHRRRKWKLKHLNVNDEGETDSVERDYNDFLEDLEEDVEYRKNVDIYKDPTKLAVDEDDADDTNEFPKITLQDMLDDLTLEEDATGEEGGPMQE